MNAKALYGHVETPKLLVDRIVDQLPRGCQQVLDCGAGHGNITTALVDRIANDGRVDAVEVSAEAVAVLKARANAERWGGKVAVVHADFLTWDGGTSYDAVVANPPYNTGGAVKTPTNTSMRKTEDGRVVWRAFVRRALGLLRPGGHGVFLVPSIWMRGGPKNWVYAMLTVEHELVSVRCMSTSETNRAFAMQAQTPTCVVHVRKPTGAPSRARMWDDTSGWAPISNGLLSARSALPTMNVSLMLRLHAFIEAGGAVPLAPLVTKASLPKRTNPPKPQPFAGARSNVRTCVLTQPDQPKRAARATPSLVYEYTAASTRFVEPGRPKLILAHKMYGMPFLDASGALGVTSADSYVVRAPESADRASAIKALRRIQTLLCGPVGLLVFESMRYRMRFLEREAFAYLPDVSGWADDDVHAPALYDRLGLGEVDRDALDTFFASRRFTLDPARMTVA